MVKAYCGELVNEVMYNCVQFHGGMGFMRESTIERMSAMRAAEHRRRRDRSHAGRSGEEDVGRVAPLRPDPVAGPPDPEEDRANNQGGVPMEIVPLGPGFAAELRGVTLSDVAGDDAVCQAVRAAFEDDRSWCFAIRT